MSLTLLALFTLLADGPPDLSGTWAREQVTLTVTDVPFVGQVVNTARAVSILQVAQRGDRVRWVETACDLDFESSNSLINISVGPGFVNAVSGEKTRARLVRQEGRWWLEQPRQGRVLGAILKEPARDPLPQDPEDPRLTDPDKDGLPGVTVRVSGLVDGTVWVVQRDWTAMRGLVQPDGDAIAGSVDFGSEQRQLGASDWRLREPLPSRPHPDPSLNTFRMVRIPNGSTCTSLLDRAKKLFPRG